jgi:hypothetical protein
MKTVAEITKREKALREEANIANFKRTKKIKSELKFLKLCRLYLETSPTESYLLNESSRLKNTIGILEGRFSEWAKTKSGGGEELLREYYSLIGRSELRAKLKTIRFLLRNE